MGVFGFSPVRARCASAAWMCTGTPASRRSRSAKPMWSLSPWVRMELAGAFRLGGDVERAFEYGLSHLLAGIEQDG
jgi:hypothetical protein